MAEGVLTYNVEEFLVITHLNIRNIYCSQKKLDISSILHLVFVFLALKLILNLNFNVLFCFSFASKSEYRI